MKGKVDVMDKKNLVIKTALCDTRNVTEEYLNAYESIEIKAATLLVSRRSKELLSRYNIKMNVSNMMEISEDVEIKSLNGNFEISESTKMSKPTLLIVNGFLDIKKNSEEALKTFVGIFVNGCVSYPSDLGNHLPPLTVNGSVESYPSDAIRLKNNLILDKTFILTAKNAKYFVKNKVVIADDTLDILSLIEKGTSFITKKAVIAEKLLENAVKLFEDDTEINVIPAGYTYVQDEDLNDLTIKKYGDKLYVDGDLKVTSKSEKALEQLTGLTVNGTVLVLERLADKLLNLNIEYKDLKYIKDKIICDKGLFSVSKNTISRYHEGVMICDCGLVKIDPDITPEEIEEKLQFIDCGVIICQPEQKEAVELVSEDVGLIRVNNIESHESSDKEVDDKNLYDKNTQVIKASTYTM